MFLFLFNIVVEFKKGGGLCTDNHISCRARIAAVNSGLVVHCASWTPNKRSYRTTCIFTT